ncbi:MAG: 50S ribosomal protein L29 [Patescibacteria group bacterium]
MRKKEIQEWRKKKEGEMKKELEELRERLALLRADLSVGKVKNIREVRFIKKSIAQLETIQNSR